MFLTSFTQFNTSDIKLPVFSVILASMLFLTACDSGSEKPKRERPAHLVETVLASYQDISASRTLPGTLQAIREIQIINQAPGLLLELPVYPGDKVITGQTLAQLDDTLLKAEKQKALATLNQAKVDLRRLKDLAPRKLASESEIAQAQTRKDIAYSELQLKQTEFKHTHITAPIDGFISARMAEPGDVMPLHSPLLSLIDTTSLKAEINLSELLLPLIEIGNTVEISIDALGNQTFNGQIKRIYPSIDKNTRRGTIEIILHPVPKDARAGQLCRVTIHTKSKSRLMIPYDTIRFDKQGAYVYILNNDVTQRVNITIGLQQEQLVEVLDGINAQQEVISKGFFGLKDKMKVKKVNTDSAEKSQVEKTSQPAAINSIKLHE